MDYAVSPHLGHCPAGSSTEEVRRVYLNDKERRWSVLTPWRSRGQHVMSVHVMAACCHENSTSEVSVTCIIYATVAPSNAGSSNVMQRLYNDTWIIHGSSTARWHLQFIFKIKIIRYSQGNCWRIQTPLTPPPSPRPKHVTYLLLPLPTWMVLLYVHELYSLNPQILLKISP